MESSTSSRIDFLDAVRGVAALVVTVGHGLEQWIPGYLAWSTQYFNVGRVGITAFFLVSGYVIGLTLTKQSIRTFAIRRFWRLYPVYWLTTIVFVATSWLSGTWHSEYGLFVILINVTMIQGFFSVASILTPAWTLGSELVFYIQSAGSKAASMLDRSVWLGYAWLLLFFGFAMINVFSGRNLSGVAPLMLFTSSLGFSVFLWDKNRSRHWIGLSVSAVVFVPILGWALLSGSGGEWSHFAFSTSYLSGLAMFGVFYLKRFSLFPCSLLWLGSISYALYLVHVSVFSAFNAISVEGGLMLLVPATLVSLVLAWLLHRYVEQPCVRLGRQLSTRQPLVKK